jgi:hypothetical protein
MMKTTLFRKLALYVGLIALLGLGLWGGVPAAAQGSPSQPILDEIFRQLSTRIGIPVSTTRLDGFYTFEEVVVNDNNLGCPNGANAAPGQTRAWVVKIQVNGYGTYEYRSSRDGAVLFYCQGTGINSQALPVPTAMPSAPVGAATPLGGTLYAGTDGAGNVVVGLAAPGSIPVPITGDARGTYPDPYFKRDKVYTYLTWSPDGTRLAFVELFSQALYLVESGSAPRMVATRVSTALPPSFSPDGRELAYAVDTGQMSPTGGGATAILQVQAIPVTGGSPRALLNLDYSVGCGGAGFSPALLRYWDENGYNGSRPIMAWTPSGILASTSCINIGYRLTALNGARIWEAGDVARLSLSPNMSRAVGVVQAPGQNPSAAVLIDVATGNRFPLALAVQPDQISFTNTGAEVVYSARTLQQTVPGDPAAPLGLELFPAWPITAERYQLAVFKQPVSGGAPVQLLNEFGYAVGRLAASPVAPVFSASVVGDDVDAVLQTNARASQAQIAASGPKVNTVLLLSAGSIPGFPFVIPGTVGQVTFSAGALFTPVPAAVTPALRPIPTVIGTGGDNPLGLIVGGRAVVPPGGSVNLRREPAIAADNVLGLLRPGDTVVILQGPVRNGNLRWWQVRRESNGLTGWVVDQFVNNNGVVEDNLRPLR